MNGKETEGLSWQQKLWKGGGTVLYAVRPLALYLALPALLMCIGMLLPGRRDAQDMTARSGNFYYTLGIILTIWLLHKRSRKRGSSLLEDVTLEYKGVNLKKAALLLAMGLGGGWFFSAFLTVAPLPRFLMAQYSSVSDGLRIGTDQLLALLSTVLLAPVAEELIFRGYMLNRLMRWFIPERAVLISSVLFALCHVSIIWMLYALFMGVMLARVAVKEDNIIYSMILHVGFNLNVLPVWIINNNPGLRSVLFGNNWLIALYGAVAAAAAVWLYRRYRREEGE